MGKRKVHDELPFSSDDEINSDDFDSDSDTEMRKCDRTVPTKSRNKFVTGLYSVLGITDEEVLKLKSNQINSRSVPAVPVLKSGRQPPEVIVFDDPSKRNNRAKAGISPTSKDWSKESHTDSKKKKADFIDLNTARHEVRQLGIKGFEGTKKEDAVLEMLTKLGAKGPKKACINYKELQIKNKKEKEESSVGKWEQDKRSRRDTGRKRKSKKEVKGVTLAAKKKTSRHSAAIQRISSKDLKKMKNT